LLSLLVSFGAHAANLEKTAVPAALTGVEIELGSDLRVVVESGRTIELLVKRAPGERYEEIARRVAGTPERASGIEQRNRAVATSGFVHVPLAWLSDEYRALVLLNLFPRDRREGEDWIHVARSGAVATYDEGLWQVAEWFTGDGARFSDLLRANRLSSPELLAGQVVRIPGAWLHSSLKALPTSDDGSLQYGTDDRGPYAGYRIKAGEALYSAVVMRYTGRTDPDDVTAVASELASRSGIREVTDIPISFLVKIPFDLLEPEFLPRADARRREVEAAKAELAAELAQRPVKAARKSLQGVVVILDPGHGGRDLGTMSHGIWEHDYVYDVACRLRQRLETETSARVYMTLEDQQTGCAPSVEDRLVANRQGTLRTSPPFLAREDGESEVAVNLRWYLANSILRESVRDGIDPDRVVFVSLHADARHPSLRGVMVYVPGARYREGVNGHKAEVYGRFREVREQPTTRFNRQERVRSEAVSRRLAARVVEAFRKEGLAVQPYQPVRERVIRGRSTWLPAVLRGNAVPAKVLVEMVNLSNPQDAAVLSSAAERERLASALEQSLIRYLGTAAPPGPASARRSR
jgi:N-acetylmuramoyl-L-alanine amidase